jgi:Zn-finger nucleic acid-binding protein
MAERNGTIIEFPRGKHIGHRVCDLATEEHFYRCPACGGWVDCSELGQVFDHEGPLPHPADDWRQQDLVARANRSWETVKRPDPPYPIRRAGTCHDAQRKAREAAS